MKQDRRGNDFRGGPSFHVKWGQISNLSPHTGSRFIGRIAEHRTHTAAERDIPEIERIAVVEPGDGAGEAR